MLSEAVAAIEYQAMLLTRRLGSLPGRARRRTGTLDQSAYLLLSLLEAGGPATLAQLAARTGLDVSTLNRQTAALVRKELAERIPDPDGGTARKFRMTARGEEAWREERGASQRAVAQITEDWTPEDRAALGELLLRFNEDIEHRARGQRAAPEQG